MANDVYTYISYEDNKEWDLFTAEIADYEYNTDLDEGMNKVISTLFPEHKGKYYEDTYTVWSEVLDSKWCHIHQVDEGSLEIHSAWNAPTGLLQRITDVFGKSGIHFRIEDADWGVIGDVVNGGGDLSNCYFAKCLTHTYYNDFIKHLRGNSKKLNKLLKDTSYQNDEFIDRYEAVEYCEPHIYYNLDDVVGELSCSETELQWNTRFDRDLIVQGLSNSVIGKELAQIL